MKNRFLGKIILSILVAAIGCGILYFNKINSAYPDNSSSIKTSISEKAASILKHISNQALAQAYSDKCTCGGYTVTCFGGHHCNPCQCNSFGCAYPTCDGGGNVPPPSPPPSSKPNCTVSMSVDNPTITEGECTRVSWSTLGPYGPAWAHTASGGLYCCPSGCSNCCTKCSDTCGLCDNKVCPTKTTNYWIKIECACPAGKNCGSSTGVATVTVNPKPATGCTGAVPRCPNYYCSNGQWVCPPITPSDKPAITSFKATPSSIQSGGSTTLSWTSTGTTSAVLTDDTGTQSNVLTSGSKIVTPKISNAKYLISATGPGGTASSSLVVTVLSNAPNTAFGFNPSSVYLNQTSTLSWNIAGATKLNLGMQSKCGATPAQPASPVSAVSSQSVKGDCVGSITYYMNVYNKIGLQKLYATLNVKSGTPPPPTNIPAPITQCYATGCNGSVCADKPYTTACVWKPEYECYQKYSSQCRQQSIGKCGWDNTGELKKCLDSYNTTATPTPIPTPTPTPNCDARIEEGTVKLNQSQGQYYIIKEDGSTLNLNPKSSSQINLKGFLDHKVKVNGCFINNALELTEIAVIDVPVEVLVEEQKQQDSKNLENKPLINIASLIATGGSLSFNIVIALVLSAFVSYFIIKKPNNQ